MRENGRQNVPATEELTPLQPHSYLFSTYLGSDVQYTRNEESGKVALIKKKVLNGTKWVLQNTVISIHCQGKICQCKKFFMPQQGRTDGSR